MKNYMPLLYATKTLVKKTALLPPIRLRSSRTSFSVSCNLASRSVICSAIFVTFSPIAPRLWVMDVREHMSQQLADPEYWQSLSLFPSTCASHRQQLNTRIRTAIFFILVVLRSLLQCCLPLSKLPLSYFIWHCAKEECPASGHWNLNKLAYIYVLDRAVKTHKRQSHE